MNERQLNKLMGSNTLVDERIKAYEKELIITKKQDDEELKGHIEKAKHNLEFLNSISDSFNDWTVVACYYCLYHVALAMLLKKGFFSKEHDATLCLLIKHYYQKELSEEEIKILNEIYLDNQDILFYTQARQERKKASYSTQIIFEKQLISQLKLKTMLFVNKWKEILEEKKETEDEHEN